MRKIIIVLLVLLLCVNLAACGTYEEDKVYQAGTGFIGIVGKKNFYYDPDTKIVYVIFNESEGYRGYGYMSPYYAPNGLPYLYDANSQTLYEID